MAAYTCLSLETEGRPVTVRARKVRDRSQCAQGPSPEPAVSAAFRKQETRLNQHPIASAVMMAAIGLAASANAADPKDRKEIVRNFLKIFETGTTAPLDLVDGTKCIQHNPHVEDGVEGLKDLFGRLLHAISMAHRRFTRIYVAKHPAISA
jgi:hypothetical protein